jgi:macrolide transport system ATP-binding/permease protein
VNTEAAHERSAAPLIELQNVTKTYATTATPVHVLRDLSLSIHAGEFVAIMGASGSGKSTLMNILGCLDRPSSGRYAFAGRDVAHCSADELAQLRSETFGFVFQQYHLVSGLSAVENVEVPAVYAGLGPAERRLRGASLLRELGLPERSQHRPDQLSGGQQQRVSIARALMNGGRVLLADEPTGALDRSSGSEVMALLRQLSTAGHTIIIITHDRAVAREARRTIEISDGRVISDSGRDEGAVARGSVPRPPAARARRSSLGADLREAVHAALRALRVNLARTFLTLLGIVVGVASVVALLAIGEGTKRQVLAQLEAFGTNLMYVVPKSNDPRQLDGVLTQDDAQLVARVPHVTAAVPVLRGSVMVRAGNVDHRCAGLATSSQMPQIWNWQSERGAFFEAADERSVAPVAVLGKKLAGILFPAGEDPLRRFVLVDNVPFQIVGVLASKGTVSGDADDDDAIFMPFSTGSQRIFGTPNATWIAVAIESSTYAAETAKAVTELLTQVHRVEDFHLFNEAAAIAAETKTLSNMTMLLTLTAIISLVVGGIGVMNIMLMTVTERTSEIGIRMAVGAKRRDVLAQFLTEAVLLASLGGVLGLGLGFSVGLLELFIEAKFEFTAAASVLAFCCAVATGLIAGILPARRAARLDPVVALARQ